MTTIDPETPRPRPVAPCETRFWAFLEYRAFWIPVTAATVLGSIGLFIAALVR